MYLIYSTKYVTVNDYPVSDSYDFGQISIAKNRFNIRYSVNGGYVFSQYIFYYKNGLCGSYFTQSLPPVIDSKRFNYVLQFGHILIFDGKEVNVEILGLTGINRMQLLWRNVDIHRDI